MAYTEEQRKLLAAFAKRTAKDEWRALTPYDLIPQWFKGEKAITGFVRFKAPAMTDDLKKKCVALYDFSKTPDKSYQHDLAGVVAALLVWEALFPENFGSLDSSLVAGKLLADWDLTTQPPSIELMNEWNDCRHPIRSALLSMTCYEPYRIVTVQHCAADFLSSLAKG